jgi:hypothetical protein
MRVVLRMRVMLRMRSVPQQGIVPFRGAVFVIASGCLARRTAAYMPLVWTAAAVWMFGSGENSALRGRVLAVPAGEVAGLECA